MSDLSFAPNSVLVLIPAHNEVHTIGALVKAVRGALPSCPVLVVSDESSDGTAAAARAAGAQVLEILQQLGAWGATQAGLRYARRQGFGQVVTLDADGQHEPGCLPGLLASLRVSGADVVIGTYPQRLSRAKRLAWAWFRMLTGLTVEDLTSGLRVYGPRALRLLTSDQATLLDYQDIGVLMLLKEHGLRTTETPVRMQPRSNGHSRVFASWWVVGRYMLQTTVLCLSRPGWLRPPRRLRRAEQGNS